MSEALQSLTARLAEQLQDEADLQVLQIKALHAGEMKTIQDALKAAQLESQTLKKSLSESQAEVAIMKGQFDDLNAAFLAETKARSKAEQHGTDLQLQLESEKGHRAATEVKYGDARRALDHFHEASREQREQDTRKHDNQVQFLQQEIHGLKESLTQAQLKSAEAFQELARMTSELGAARRELAQQETLKGQLQSLNEQLANAQNQRDVTGSELVHEKQRSTTLQLELDRVAAQRVAAEEQVQGLQSELLTMKVRLETSEQVTEKIRLQVEKIIGAAAKRAASDGKSPH